MPYKISIPWIDSFDTLALTGVAKQFVFPRADQYEWMVLDYRLGSDLSDEVIGHGLSFNKLIIMWNRMAASPGRGLEQRAEKRWGWSCAEYVPKRWLWDTRKAHPSQDLAVPRPCWGTRAGYASILSFAPWAKKISENLSAWRGKGFNVSVFLEIPEGDNSQELVKNPRATLHDLQW